MAKTFYDAINEMNKTRTQNIAITGDIGSGKSTVANKLAEKLGMTIIDSGQLYRKFAADKNMNVLEQNKSGDWSIDKEIDSTIEDIGRTQNNIIFVSRLAWHFVPSAIKIYLKVNPIIAAERLLQDKRVSEKHNDLNETLEYNRSRKTAELSRYKEMYSIDDPSGYSNADIICNIGKNDVDSVVECLYDAISIKAFGYYVDPKCLLPTQVIRDFNMDTIEYYNSILESVKTINATLISYNDCVYINDGHHRIVSCIKLNKSFIRTPLPSVIRKLPDIPLPYDYEELAGVNLSKEYSLHCSYMNR